MGLRAKILIGYGVALALVAAVVAWSVFGLFRLGKASDAILKENYRSILAAENMVDALERQDSAVLLTLLGNVRMGDSLFMENESVFLQWLARAKDNVTIPGEGDLLRSIETDYTGFRGLYLSPKEALPPAGQPREAGLKTYLDTIYPRFVSVRESCIRLRNLNEETMYAASLKAGRVAANAILSTVAVAGLALAAALAFSLILSARIARPLKLLMDASRSIAGGDYTVEVPVRTGDELGHLAGEFNSMARQLSRYHEMNIDRIVSEKQKGEAILASIEDGVVVLDNELAVTGINPAARRILDLTTEEAMGMHCSDLLPENRACERIRQSLSPTEAGRPRDEDPIVTLARGNETRHYLFSVTAIRSRKQGVSGTVLLLKDVTRLKEVERLKREFIMAASHELRTPLTGLSMSIDLLMERAEPALAEKDRELLHAAHEEVHRLSSMVNDLLDLSRMETGSIALEFRGVEVPGLVEHVRSLFRSQLANRSVELSAQVPERLPKIRADANKITWVLSNLVSNALRYVKEGGHLTVAARAAGDQVRLSVKDDGPGIPPEDQARIFEKFAQVEGRESGGSGLGLAICREIVRAHGGTIWVESEPGQGATFLFTIPVAHEEIRHAG